MRSAQEIDGARARAWHFLQYCVVAWRGGCTRPRVWSRQSVDRRKDRGGPGALKCSPNVVRGEGIEFPTSPMQTRRSTASVLDETCALRCHPRACPRIRYPQTPEQVVRWMVGTSPTMTD